VGVFLGPHDAGFATVRVEQHGGLLDGVAVFDLLDLPARFVIDRLFQKLDELRFLISRRVPYSACPMGRTETLASTRKLPSCMLPSQMPIQATRVCSALA